MVAEGWHSAVLRFLRDSVGRLHKMDATQLKLVSACYRLLFYICWDHPENWSHFSNAPTLRFLFSSLEQLSDFEHETEIGPDGAEKVEGEEPLSYWCARLLEEIIVDNSEANKQLEPQHVTLIVRRLMLDGNNGRTQLLQILKAMVEDDIQPLPLRQVQVIEELDYIRTHDPTRAAEVLLYFQDENMKYRLGDVIKLYQKEKKAAEELGIKVDGDGLPDQSKVDGDLNYHLELVDLLGMCAKGRNEYTEKYCKALFDEDDVMTVLGLSHMPILIKSPFVRMLHGVYFSAASEGSSGDEASSSAHLVMTRYWDQMVKLFESFARDITRFRKWLEQDEKETDAETTRRRGLSVEKAGQNTDIDDEDEDAAVEEEAEDEGGDAVKTADLSEAAQDAKWDLLENYIFFVVIPFLTDFYTANYDLEPEAAETRPLRTVAVARFETHRTKRVAYYTK